MTRWRVPYGEKYYTITSDMEVDWEFEFGEMSDDALYESGNYFNTRSEAEAVAEKFRAILNEHNKQKGGKQ